MRKAIIITCVLIGAVAGCGSKKTESPIQVRPPALRESPRRDYPSSNSTPRFTDRPAPPPFERGWMPGGRPASPRWSSIIVHHSATPRGGARAFDNGHRAKGWDELGYHFVIGNGTDTPDGAVEVGSRWHKQKHGAHCKTPGNYYNEHGIGICLVGDFTRTRPTRAQMASLERLVRFLSFQSHIPPERVTTHNQVTGKTVCPGPHFSLAALRRSLGGSALASVYR